jgi:hypothetical protein
VGHKLKIVRGIDSAKLKRFKIAKFTETLLQVVASVGHMACNLLHQMSHFLLRNALASAKVSSCPEYGAKALSRNVDIDLQNIKCENSEVLPSEKQQPSASEKLQFYFMLPLSPVFLTHKILCSFQFGQRY